MGLRIAWALVLVAGCSAPAVAPPLRGSVTEGQVEVSVSLDGPTLSATFRPPAGYHLYSVDLPEGGVGGLGRRTAVEARAGVTATGPLRTTSPVVDLPYPSLHLTLPVYPDGPVTFTRPVRRDSGPAQVTVSFAACSDTTCLVPVVGRVVELQPAG